MNTITTEERENHLTAEERAELAVLQARYFPGDETTPLGPEYDRFLTLWTRYWYTLPIRVVFRALAAALPQFEFETSEICILTAQVGRHEISIEEVFRDGHDESDQIGMSVAGPRCLRVQCRFCLADPECFEKLAKALKRYGVTLDVEALAP